MASQIDLLFIPVSTSVVSLYIPMILGAVFLSGILGLTIGGGALFQPRPQFFFMWNTEGVMFMEDSDKTMSTTENRMMFGGQQNFQRFRDRRKWFDFR
jgi:hypothetical protein